MVSPVFAQILRSGREHFNQRFAAARRAQPELNGEQFTAFLETAVDPLVQAVDRLLPDRTTDVAMAAYDVALELAGQRIIGRGERGRIIEDGWRRVLPPVAGLVATNPVRMLGATTNALHALESTSGARPEQWLALMEKLGPASPDAEGWLKLGQVAAWRAGLAHFRNAALELADALPESDGLEIVGAPPGMRWAEIRTRLKRSPWFDPADRSDSQTRLRLAARVGAYRGFGGLFTEPPRVTAMGDHFAVISAGEAWMLVADAFGATFHRVKPEEHSAIAPRRELPGRMRINGIRVDIDGSWVDLPDLGVPSSVAINPTTLALTSTQSHQVWLVALPQS